MLKKDINEVKKSLNLKNCSISEVWESFYNVERKKEFSNSFSFESLDDNKKNAYIDIFKKTLSSNLYKNSYNIKIDNSLISEDAGGLYLLYNSSSKEVVFNFLDNITNVYPAQSSYAIILCKGLYNVPIKDDENKVLESDSVYEFYICSICPFKDNKPNLVENSAKKTLELSNNSWVLSNPDLGFLYPSFNDRTSDINESLYYTKKNDIIYDELIEFLYGPKSFNQENYSQDKYNDIIEDNVDDLTIDKFHDINTSIRTYAEEMEEQGLEPILTNSDVSRYISSDFNSNDDVAINAFSVSSDKYTITLDNSNDIKINLTKEGLGMIDEREIDGRSYILIPTTGLRINGVGLKQRNKGD